MKDEWTYVRAFTFSRSTQVSHKNELELENLIIVASYYRGAHGIFVVFDVTDRATFTNVEMVILDSLRN